MGSAGRPAPWHRWCVRARPRWPRRRRWRLRGAPLRSRRSRRPRLYPGGPGCSVQRRPAPRPRRVPRRGAGRCSATAAASRSGAARSGPGRNAPAGPGRAHRCCGRPLLRRVFRRNCPSPEPFPTLAAVTGVDRCAVNSPTVTGRARRVGLCFRQTTIHLSPIQARSSQLSARLGYYAATFPATGSISATRRLGRGTAPSAKSPARDRTPWSLRTRSSCGRNCPARRHPLSDELLSAAKSSPPLRGPRTLLACVTALARWRPYLPRRRHAAGR